MSFATADLYDAHGEALRIADPLLADFGGRRAFHGPVVTLRVFEDNSLVRERLEEPGEGRVLVVDGGGSRRCALLGDRLAALGAENGWAGVVVHGCVRDVDVLAGIDLGVRALGSQPRKSVKRGVGERDVPVSFAGITVSPGDLLAADGDGVVVLPADAAAP